jgi:hypothetical protein
MPAHLALLRGTAERFPAAKLRLVLRGLGIFGHTQHRRRVSIPAVTSKAERGIAAEPGSVKLLDQALRSLAARLKAGNLLLPAITGALVTGNGVELIPAGPADPVPPFRASWQLDPGS